MTTHTNPEHSAFLTIEEVAHELRCTPRHVRNLLARGELPSVRYGRLLRIPRSALEAAAREATEAAEAVRNAREAKQA